MLKFLLRSVVLSALILGLHYASVAQTRFLEIQNFINCDIEYTAWYSSSCGVVVGSQGNTLLAGDGISLACPVGNFFERVLIVDPVSGNSTTVVHPMCSSINSGSFSDCDRRTAKVTFTNAISEVVDIFY